MKSLYDFYQFKTFIDCYCYTTAICKLFPDIVCLSNSCSEKVTIFPNTELSKLIKSIIHQSYLLLHKLAVYMQSAFQLQLADGIFSEYLPTSLHPKAAAKSDHIISALIISESCIYTQLIKILLQYYYIQYTYFVFLMISPWHFLQNRWKCFHIVNTWLNFMITGRVEVHMLPQQHLQWSKCMFC